MTHHSISDSKTVILTMHSFHWSTGLVGIVLVLVTPRISSLMAADTSALESTIVAINNAISDDDYDKASQLLRQGQIAARKSRSARWQKEIGQIRKRVGRIRTAYGRLKSERQTLQSDPANSEACRKLGLFYCVDKSQWDKGLPLLAKCDKPELSEAAIADLNKPQEAEAKYEVAESWMKAAEAQRGVEARSLQYRARRWYLAAYDRLSESMRSSVDVRLRFIPIHVQKIVIWNAHNGRNADFGSLAGRITLSREGKVVARETVTFQWSADEQSQTVYWPPDKPIDSLRIDILKSQRNGSGLAEVEIFSDGENLAQGCSAKASSFYDERYPPSNLTDGQKGNAPSDKAGVWMAARNQPSWIVINLLRPVGN